MYYIRNIETAVSEMAVSEMIVSKDKKLCNMRFFDRTKEIAALQEIKAMSEHSAQFTVVTGRRRIGKTSLIWKAYENETFLYFFVARKAEAELCESYQLEIEQKLGIQTLGRVDSFA